MSQSVSTANTPIAPLNNKALIACSKVTHDYAIQTTDLTKAYGDKLALNRLSLEVNKGEVIGLLGPNGAGKTTLLEILEGLQKPSSGNVSIFGKSPAQLSRREMGAIGIVFQRYALPSHLTVLQLCDLYQSMYPEESDRTGLLRQLGLSHLLSYQIGDISAGQRQRLSIFAALYGKKNLVLLDEPTSALDVRSRRAVWDTLLARKRTGELSGIIATHHMEEAVELCDRIYFINHGEIKLQGKVKDLIVQHSDKMLIRFTASADAIHALPSIRSGVHIVAGIGPEYEIACAASAASSLIADILSLEQQTGVRVNLAVSQPSLEDVYLNVIASPSL